MVVTDWAPDPVDGVWFCKPGEVAALDEHPADIYHAMVVGLRDYVNRNRFPGVVLGLSGGSDSALSAAVAVDALGADRVWCVMMPSRFTSQDSLDDAAECARLLGCRLDTIPIGPAIEAFDEMLAPAFAGRPRDLAEENIQSRIGGMTLMALSNKFGPMLLTTGNKSEMSVGYATIYGDMAGGYSVLKDAYKTTVFALSRWRNEHKPEHGIGPAGPSCPSASSPSRRPPSCARTRRTRTACHLMMCSTRSCWGLVEQEKSVDQLVAAGYDRETVTRIERLLYVAEYKRRQSPPGVKLGGRNFGRDRRYPITNAFRNGRMNQRYPLIEGFGYFISIISVALLGLAAWLGAEGRPICASPCVRAPRFSVMGMILRWYVCGAVTAAGSIINDRHHAFRAFAHGSLHVGNVRTALHNWLWARRMGGSWFAAHRTTPIPSAAKSVS